MRTDIPTLVLVHGGGHDSRCWTPTIGALAAQLPQLPVVAVDLPGRGRCATPLEAMTIATCADAVIDQLGEVSDGGEVVVVGHSMAGLVLPSVAARLGPGRVRRLVYVAANAPAQGQSTLESLNGPLRLFALVGQRALREGPMPWFAARRAFCNGMDAGQRQLVRDQLVPESLQMIRERVDRTGLDPSIPATWVLTLRDRALSRKAQEQSIANLGAVDKVVEIDTCHDAMVSEPEALARLLLVEAEV